MYLSSLFYVEMCKYLEAANVARSSNMFKHQEFYM
jgi:hypothetical protein